MQRKLDSSLDKLAQQEAKNFHGDPDQPMTDFSYALDEIVRSPISDQKHVIMLRKAIDYLISEGGQPYEGTLEQAMDAAFEDAMDCVDPL